MELLKENLIPWSISNGIALVVLATSFRWTKLTRLFFFILFAWASWLNYTTAHKTPDYYLIYATLTPFEGYHNFIIHWFKSNIVTTVTLISIGQGLIAFGIILKGMVVKIACAGAILFFIAIAPLGIGSGFPATLIAAAATFLIVKKDNLDYLWHFKKQNSKHKEL
ncbi:MAG: hypothetical protein VX798_03625 [Bacteroidota bacterium]|uniref:DoxX family protein n=1 Tax=Flagellimonas profundi TaxID=2915620 RepID=A0ABS3FBC0_9FLAO|nr:hypothetical protein [Allomuricauda profundi]MBO0340460.1 hypothetical protein [Allomuricauda profundi]MEC7770244.1 hypothetical protein [Bacteroidota bacterium]